MQLMIEGISTQLQKRLEERAKVERKTLSQVAVESLESALGVNDRSSPPRDLRFMVESGPLEPEVEEALTSMRSVNPEEWK